MKPRLLDLFAGCGGAARGYQLAGFHVTGVDIESQPNYCGDDFFQADAMTFDLAGYDVIHASPPCHDHSTISRSLDGSGVLLEQTLARLVGVNVPWVCENVVGPDVKMGGWWFMLCGSMFGLRVRRHRRFGSSDLLMPPGCRHREQGRPFTVTGHGGGKPSAHSMKPLASEFWRYLDMPWMEGKPPYGVAQAIPPVYTFWIGAQLLENLAARVPLPPNRPEDAT